jgi:alkyl sulfatase BDS1-like metallo-beta-lactamase superfamily hydrolase
MAVEMTNAYKKLRAKLKNPKVTVAELKTVKKGYFELEDKVKALDRVWAQRVLMVSSVKDFQLVAKTESKAIENLKSCLDNFDQGQFDPDLIDVFKNQVINQFVDNMVEDSHDRNN